MQRAAVALIAALSVLLGACATTSRELRVAEVDIADSAVLTLPEARELTDRVAATQLLTATYEDQSYTMQVELEWRHGSMFIVALNTLGTVAFSLSYDGSAMEIRSNSLLARRIRAENVLADILLTFWDRSRLQPRLRGDALALVDSANKRSLLRDGRPVIVIDYESESRWEGTVRFEHVERDYVLEIETIRHDGS